MADKFETIVQSLGFFDLYEHYLGGSGSNIAISINNLHDNLSSENIADFDAMVRGAVDRMGGRDGTHFINLTNVRASFTEGERNTVGRFYANISLKVTINDGNLIIDNGKWSQYEPDSYDFLPTWGDRGPGIRGLAANIATKAENIFENVIFLGSLPALITKDTLSRESLNALVARGTFSRPFDIRIEGERTLDITQCFAAATPICLPDGGIRPIEAIRVGDRILSFDAAAGHADAPLRVGRVARIFHGITTEFIVLTVSQAGTPSWPITVTPGHHFQSADGGGSAGRHMIGPDIHAVFGTARPSAQVRMASKFVFRNSRSGRQRHVSKSGI